MTESRTFDRTVFLKTAAMGSGAVAVAASGLLTFASLVTEAGSGTIQPRIDNLDRHTRAIQEECPDHRHGPLIRTADVACRRTA